MFVIDSSWTGPCCRIHSLVPGHEVFVRCRASVPHLESRHCWRDVVEKINRKNGPYRLAVARPVGTPRMVSCGIEVLIYCYCLSYIYCYCLSGFHSYCLVLESSIVILNTVYCCKTFADNLGFCVSFELLHYYVYYYYMYYWYCYSYYYYSYYCYCYCYYYYYYYYFFHVSRATTDCSRSPSPFGIIWAGFFYRLYALPVAQPTVSELWRVLEALTSTRKDHKLCSVVTVSETDTET